MSYSPNPAPQAAAGGQTNMLAVASLVVSILALLSACTFIGFIPLLLGIVGAALGFVARNQIRQRPGQSGDGLALAGLIVGILAAIIGALELAGVAALIGLGNELVNQAAATLTAEARP